MPIGLSDAEDFGLSEALQLRAPVLDEEGAATRNLQLGWLRRCSSLLFLASCGWRFSFARQAPDQSSPRRSLDSVLSFRVLWAA